MSWAGSPLRVLPVLGVAVIPTVHCMLWTRNNPPTGRVRKILAWLDRPLWRRSSKAIMSASSDITRQIEETSGGEHRPIVHFLPTYRDNTFEAAPTTGDARSRSGFYSRVPD